MKNNKNGFLTFCCSLVPGAGEMYMGLYKQGISLMFWFFLSGIVGGWLNFEVIWAIAPVIWCFSFFHTHNLRRMSDEEFNAQEDRYILFNNGDIDKAKDAVTNHKGLVGGMLIFIGVCMILRIVMEFVSPFIDGVLWDLAWGVSRRFASGISALVVIIVGICLLRNRNKEEEAECAAE